MVCMGVRSRPVTVAVLVAIALAGLRPGRAQEAAPAPFLPGERLAFDVTWSVFRAGEVSATLTKAGEGPQDPYEVRTTARSQGFASLLFKVQNEFRSQFDAQTLCSRQISKKVNEGRRRKETKIVFDAERRLAVLDERDLTKENAPAKHAESAIPSCVQDVVSAFYYLRRQPLNVGQEFLVPLNDGSKTYEVTVEVQARERLQTPLGSRTALRVEPKVFGGLYKRKGRMLIWLSDDEQHLPLRIKAAVSVGAITGTLKSVTTEAAGASPAKH